MLYTFQDYQSLLVHVEIFVRRVQDVSIENIHLYSIPL